MEMNKHDMTAEEFFESLTGFDEIAVKKQFGSSVIALSQEDQALFARALIFVAEKRRGLNDADAFMSAMNVPLGQINDYFAEDTEVNEFHPVTEQGKDD